MADQVKRYSNVIGFDDAPFGRSHRGEVSVVGTVYADLRLDGVLIGTVTKDGIDAAARLACIVSDSKFQQHAQLIMLQGIALAGFNVVDVFELQRRLGLPVLVVSRKMPDLPAIQNALVSHVPDGHRKWELIVKLGPMEPLERVYVQRVGIGLEAAAAVIRRFAVHSHIPEPLRSAHLIAGALACGQSRGNP